MWHLATTSPATSSQFQSTHPRRVWLCFKDTVKLTPGFQSTHPRRVWLLYLYLIIYIESFNPHTHEGCDAMGSDSKVIEDVSIHTPTKGVTLLALLWRRQEIVSIHTPTKGVTKKKNSFTYQKQFQSTHPRRVWPMFFWNFTLSAKFQSTHPRRVWHATSSIIWDSQKFQSTHPRRVWRVQAYNISANEYVSIHTPTKGVTVW